MSRLRSWPLLVGGHLAFGICHLAFAAAPAPSRPLIQVTPKQGKILVTCLGSPIATYVHTDPVIHRPYLAHVRMGRFHITRNHPPLEGKDPTDHATMHPGIWLAFGDINGIDFWRNKGRVVHQGLVERPWSSAGFGQFTVRNAYHGPDRGEAICTEVCRITFLGSRPRGTWVLWKSTFHAGKTPVVFGDQEEMGLGVRVATPMTEKNGGTILDAQGREGAQKVWGNAAKWCDYSGTVDGKPVGVTLLCAPGNFRPSWFHARDYGLLVANPFGREAMRKGKPSTVVIQPGKSLTLRYGILLHAGPKPNLDAAYAEYLKHIRVRTP